MATALDEYLSRLYSVDKHKMTFGLERSICVADRLSLRQWDCPVVMVGGTNGKGSVLQTLDAIYAKAGCRRALYTSPHLHCFNERICINSVPVCDEKIMSAFKAIDAARAEVPLSFFEQTTLACLWLAKQEPIDVLLLEVGLGGRLDVVNIVDADVAVITSIDFDHVDILGDTREKIAAEKAGILRSNQIAICGEADVPEALLAAASTNGVELQQFGRQFQMRTTADTWAWENDSVQIRGQKKLSLRPDNAACAIQAALRLSDRLPVSLEQIAQAVSQVKLSGRIERQRFLKREVVFDVSHNPSAVSYLADSLAEQLGGGITFGIFQALVGKDVCSMLKPMLPKIDAWLIPALDDPRSYDAAELAAILKEMTSKPVACYTAPVDAVEDLQARWGQHDRCVVFGSFVTVGVVRALMEAKQDERFE